MGGPRAVNPAGCGCVLPDGGFGFVGGFGPGGGFGVVPKGGLGGPVIETCLQSAVLSFVRQLKDNRRQYQWCRLGGRG